MAVLAACVGGDDKSVPLPRKEAFSFDRFHDSGRAVKMTYLSCTLFCNFLMARMWIVKVVVWVNTNEETTLSRTSAHAAEARMLMMRQRGRRPARRKEDRSDPSESQNCPILYTPADSMFMW